MPTRQHLFAPLFAHTTTSLTQPPWTTTSSAIPAYTVMFPAAACQPHGTLAKLASITVSTPSQSPNVHSVMTTMLPHLTRSSMLSQPPLLVPLPTQPSARAPPPLSFPILSISVLLSADVSTFHYPSAFLSILVALSANVISSSLTLISLCHLPMPTLLPSHHSARLYLSQLHLLPTLRSTLNISTSRHLPLRPRQFFE